MNTPRPHGEWRDGAGAMRPAADRVDVWIVSLAGGANALRTAAHVLAPEEWERARRMRHGGVRFALARAALRRRLAHALGTPAREVSLVERERGKPVLSPVYGASLRFSLAHSGDVALVALRLGDDVGVDVERVRSDVDGDAVARALFSPRERLLMASLGAASEREAFFRAWVRREALAKASGLGVATGDHERANDGVVVRELAGVPGCAAAVASRGDAWTVMRWSESDVSSPRALAAN